MGFLRSLLDLFGVAIIIPVINVMVQPESVRRSRVLNAVYEAGGFRDMTHFALTLTFTVFAVFVLRAVFTWFLATRQSQTVFRIIERIALSRFLSYLRMPYRYYTEQNSSVLLRNFLILPFEFGQRVMLPYVLLTNELLISSIILAAMVWYKPMLFLAVALVLVPAVLLFQLSLRRVLREATEQKDDSGKMLFKDSSQAMHLFREIVLLHKYDYFRSRFSRGLKILSDVTARVNSLNEFSPKVVELIAVAGVAFVFVFAQFLKLPSAELVEFLVVFAIVVSRLIPSSNRILLYNNTIRTNDYVYEHLSNLPPVDATNDDAIAEPLVFNKSIDIRDLSFGYGGQRADVLSDLTLRIRKGETVGIVGPSGSGKTTLLNVLLRLFDESKGGIYVDGEKVDAANRESWYRLIGFVPQNINLLDDDFLHNIAFGVPDDQIDFEKVKEVARRAELLDLIQQSSSGFQTQIGESGIKISGGQRQRIGIARALYTDAQILIFDEATSQLDMRTEEQITESIRSLSHKDLTIVIVAHRLQTLRYCDSIYRIENGQLSPKLEYADLLKA